MSSRGRLAVRRDFTPLWKKGVIASGVLVTIFLVSLLTRGLNLGIDFEGGGLWDSPAGDASVADVRDALRPLGQDGAQIQEGTDQAGDRRVTVRTEVVSPEESDTIRRAIAEVTDSGFDDVDTTTVGPSWGDEITNAARTALIWFFIAIALYMAARLEWRMAVGGLLAVLHDIIITVGVYSIFGFEVTPATVIAFLTILGYSLYDTVVVFDRVRENEARNAGTKASFRSILNVSISQVITRSINTTITSVLPVLSLLVVGSFILGATTLREFGVALLIGLIAGTYSSLFVATPVLLWLKERDPKWAQLKEREERLGAAEASTTDSDADGSRSGSVDSAKRRLAKVGAAGGGAGSAAAGKAAAAKGNAKGNVKDAGAEDVTPGSDDVDVDGEPRKTKPKKRIVPGNQSSGAAIPPRPSAGEIPEGLSHAPRGRKQKNRKKK